MRRFLVLGISLLLLLSTALLTVRAADVALFASCADHHDPDRTVVWFGYEASAPIEGTGYAGPASFVGLWGMPPNTLAAGRHERIFGVELSTERVGFQFATSTGATYEAWVEPDADLPDCADLWQPGAPSIDVTLESDCAFVDIRDAYDHWSRVTSQGAPVLLHYGEQLIGGPGQSTDAEDYRAVPTACY